MAVVTGGAKGIGRSIAVRLAREGADVAVADIALDDACAVGDEIKGLGRQFLPLKVDVSCAEDVEHMGIEVFEGLGAVDILVNNAGILSHTPLLETSEREWDAIMSTNLKGSFLCAQSIAKLMIRNSCSGKIINISSIDGLTVYRHSHHGAYGVSKAGIIMLTKILAGELAPFGICVNAVCPGVVPTSISSGSLDDGTHRGRVLKDIPLGRFGETDEIAAVVAFLASSDASYMTGAIVQVDGGWTIY